MYNESYLHVLTSLCNKVHVMSLRIHSLRRKNILFYVRDTIKKPVKNLTLWKGLEKSISRMLLYVTARPITRSHGSARVL